MDNIQNNINRKIGKWKHAHIVGFSIFIMALSFAMVLLIAGKSTKVRADDSSVIYLESPNKASNATSFKMPPAITKPQDEIPTTVERNVPVSAVGISKNSEVNLTDAQVAFIKAFNDYLVSKGNYAIVTSGKRTSDQQLNIIKDRVVEHGASSKFPKLEEATVADTKIWLKAWQWLRRKRVPVNAPAAVPGADVATSMHLKGLAIDFISSDLDNLRSWLATFAHSSYAKESKLHIAAIVREPGCVHVNLG
jgi:hypothetical protein